MGTWGPHAFENDEAGDFGSALAKGGVPSIECALDLVLENDGYLEAPDCWNAVAASETLCVMVGRPGPSIPAEVAQWASVQERPSPQLVAKAKHSLARILRNSELKELWSESPDVSVWEGSIADVTRRLG
jgi:hypothetical protein